MRLLKKFWKDEAGVGVVEIVLILVVLIGLVVIFRNQITALMNSLFEGIGDKAAVLY